MAEWAKLALIQQWLPSMVSEEQLQEWVKDAIKEVGPNNMVKVVGDRWCIHELVILQTVHDSHTIYLGLYLWVVIVVLVTVSGLLS